MKLALTAILFRSARDIKPPQWVSLVQSAWEDGVSALTPSQSKAQVIKIIHFITTNYLISTDFICLCFYPTRLPQGKRL